MTALNFVRHGEQWLGYQPDGTVAGILRRSKSHSRGFDAYLVRGHRIEWAAYARARPGAQRQLVIEWQRSLDHARV